MAYDRLFSVNFFKNGFRKEGSKAPMYKGNIICTNDIILKAGSVYDMGLWIDEGNGKGFVSFSEMEQQYADKVREKAGMRAAAREESAEIYPSKDAIAEGSGLPESDIKGSGVNEQDLPF